MPEPRFSWTQPCCDSCWRERNPGRQAHRFYEGERKEEICVFCGATTLSGIYVRIDPASDLALYPTHMKE